MASSTDQITKPCRWLVTTYDNQIEVRANRCEVSVGGAIAFRTDDRQVFKVFAQGQWARVEMIDDPFGNAMVSGPAFPKPDDC
jgi:hypothetical protein